MDVGSAGVGEGHDGRDTKPSIAMGGGVISQGAKPCSPAKARPRQAERGCLCLSWGIQGLKMK